MNLHPRAARFCRDEQGMGLLFGLLTAAVVAAIAWTMMTSGLVDMAISDNYRSHSAAFYAADAGIEQTLIDFKVDESWVLALVDLGQMELEVPGPGTITINGNTVTLQLDGDGNVIPGYYTVGQPTSIGEGTFTREVWLPPTISFGDCDEIEAPEAEGSEDESGSSSKASKSKDSESKDSKSKGSKSKGSKSKDSKSKDSKSKDSKSKGSKSKSSSTADSSSSSGDVFDPCAPEMEDSSSKSSKDKSGSKSKSSKSGSKSKDSRDKSSSKAESSSKAKSGSSSDAYALLDGLASFMTRTNLAVAAWWAGSSQPTPSESTGAGSPERVEFCHFAGATPKTLNLSTAATAVHLANHVGDHMGACTEAELGAGNDKDEPADELDLNGEDDAFSVPVYLTIGVRTTGTSSNSSTTSLTADIVYEILPDGTVQQVAVRNWHRE